MSTSQAMSWFLSLCGLLIGYTFVLPYFISPLRHIPGPFLAKFTNLWRLINNYGGRPELRHRLLHEQYGPVVRLGPTCVSLSDPKLIKTIYTTRGEFIKSEFYSVNDVKVGKSTVSTLFGTRSNAFHTSQTRLLHKYYAMTSLKVFEPHVDIILEKLQTRLAEEFINGENTTCKLNEWMDLFSWDVIGQITFSKPFGFLEKGGDVNEMISTAEKALDYFSIVGQMPWLDQVLDKNPIKRIGPPSFNVATDLCVNETIKRLSGADKNEHDPEKQKDFLDYWLNLKEENPEAVGVNEIVGLLLLNILAGADTTVATLCAILYYVLKNPRVYHKLRSELDSSGHSLPMSYDDAVALPYLTAIVRESMRMHPGVGLPLERIVPNSGLTTPNGVTLPPGTIVGMNAWVVHMDKTTFGQDAASFVPERWLRSDHETEEGFKSRIAAMNAADLTFGAGKRVCIGKNVSLLQIYKIIPMMFLKYDMNFVDPTKDWKIQNSWFVRQTGLDVQIRLRQGKTG